MDLIVRDMAVARGGMRDLEAVRNLIASPVSLALFDLPFAPLYLAAVYIFHPVLGVVQHVLPGLVALDELAQRRWHRAGGLRRRVREDIDDLRADERALA